MISIRNKLSGSPTLVRIAPFFIFAALTFFQGKFGESSRYWIYLIKTVLGAGMIFAVRPYVQEMRWKISGEAVLAGVVVFAIWVGLDKFYPHLGKTGMLWNPHQQFGNDSSLAWLFIFFRIVGSSLVVPPLEEVFYRSFVYRYIIRPDFQTVPLGQFRWGAFVITSTIFGLAHHEWLAGIFCGIIYQGLVCRKKRLGDAMTAHAITNFLLGLWVTSRNAWNFW